MSRLSHPYFACLLPALVLGACAGETGRYPSLAPRAVEKGSFDEPAAPPPAPVVADPALDARLARIGSDLGRLARGFDADAAKAQAAGAAARGQPVGSEAWLDAQALIATLDDWHAQTSALVTDAEELALDRAAALAPDYPALAAMQRRLSEESKRQSARIVQLAAALPAP